MASAGGRLQAYEKTSVLNIVVDFYSSVVRFIGHVQLKGGRPRTVEAYRMMLRLLARHAGQDPAVLDEEAVRAFFLHLLRDRQYAPQSIRQARAALTAFYMEMLGRADWTVLASVKTKDLVKLPVVLSRDEVRHILGLAECEDLDCRHSAIPTLGILWRRGFIVLKLLRESRVRTDKLFELGLDLGRVINLLSFLVLELKRPGFGRKDATRHEEMKRGFHGIFLSNVAVQAAASGKRR